MYANDTENPRANILFLRIHSSEDILRMQLFQKQFAYMIHVNSFVFQNQYNWRIK